MVIDETPLYFQEPTAGATMPPFTPADFFALLPEFVGKQTDIDVLAAIAAARPTFSPVLWGQYFHVGMANYLAHRFTVLAYVKARGLAGQLADDKTSKAVGSVSVGRSAELLRLKMLDPFMGTIYGQEYRRLQRLVSAGARAV